MNVAASRRWTTADSLAATFITVIAGVLRAARLTTPRGLYFDESYYAVAGCLYVRDPVNCGLPRATATLLPQHPPLGPRLLPAVPFMCLALGYAMTQVAERWRWRWRVAAIASISVVLSFAFYYPVLAAVPLSYSAWTSRIVFRDCLGAGATVRSPHPGDGNATRPLPNLGPGEPPDGWCWI